VHIPGISERKIASLFSDDTTTFLVETDSYDDLSGILTMWCTASGAKFNKGKTVAIPIGTPEYRKSVMTHTACLMTFILLQTAKRQGF
jgi:hypothetical protein